MLLRYFTICINALSAGDTILRLKYWPVLDDGSLADGTKPSREQMWTYRE